MAGGRGGADRGVLAASAARAALVVDTEYYNGGAGDDIHYPVSAVDLVNEGQPSLASSSAENFYPLNGSSPSKLNDGSPGATVAVGTTAFSYNEQSQPAYGDTWTNTFFLAAGETGFVITNITVVAGRQADRWDQRYTVYYSTVAAPTVYSVLAAVSFNVPQSGTGSSRTVLRDSAGGALANGVARLRFLFQRQPDGYLGTVWREVDVFGYGDAAPPSSIPVGPDDASITYSDYAHLSLSPTMARFDRLITGAGSGMGWDNPGTRIRFRTDAFSIAARLSYNGLHTHGAMDGTAVLLRDGAVAAAFEPSARPGANTLTLASLAAPELHTYELLLPYGDSADFLGLTVSTGAAFHAVAARPGTRYVAYGDSISQGYWASNPTRNYPWQVGTNRDWEVVNMGFGGRQLTASDGLSVGALGASVVTVLMGYNDAAAGKSTNQYAADLAGFLQNVRSLQEVAPIYVITPLWSSANPNPTLLAGYRTVIDEYVARSSDRNLHRIDGLALVPGSPTYFPDGVHPNDAGFALMAGALAPQLSTAFVPGPFALTVTAEAFQNDDIHYAVSTGDLVNAGQRSLVSSAAWNFQPYLGSSPERLNDGTPGLSATGGAPVVASTAFSYNDVVPGDKNWTNTFILASEDGYALTNITVVAGWLSSRWNQIYDVQYSTFGAPELFLPLTNVSYIPSAAGTVSTRTMIHERYGRPFLRDVAAVRFIFRPSGGEGTVWREVDVSGTDMHRPGTVVSLR